VGDGAQVEILVYWSLRDSCKMSFEHASRVGWLPGWQRTEDGCRVALLVPVDPFRGHLDDLGRAVDTESYQRPDLNDRRHPCRGEHSSNQANRS
jgi:hypothetical protein